MNFIFDSRFFEKSRNREILVLASSCWYLKLSNSEPGIYIKKLTYKLYRDRTCFLRSDNGIDKSHLQTTRKLLSKCRIIYKKNRENKKYYAGKNQVRKEPRNIQKNIKMKEQFRRNIKKLSSKLTKIINSYRYS